MKYRASIGVLLTLLSIITIVVVLPTVGFGEVPQQVSYQGRLTDAGGNPLGGAYVMSFSVYNVSAGGTALWLESQTVTVDGGIYNVQIGQDPTGNPFPPNLFDSQRWLGVSVGTDSEMLPRQMLTSTPFAMRAAVADSVENGVIETIHLASNAVTSDKIGSSAVTVSHIQDGAVISEILDDDGAGSGLDADTLDGLQASSFVLPDSDYGRSGVTGNLYEGTMTLADKYINQSGDDMTGQLTVSFFSPNEGWNEAIKGALSGSGYGAGITGITYTASSYGVYGAAFDTSYGAGVYGKSYGDHAYGVHGGADGTNGVGVVGEATNPGSYENYGGFFTAAGTTGRGVTGYASNGNGLLNHGGYFIADGKLGRGVYGEASSTEGTNTYGGLFVSRGTAGYGVVGEAAGTTGQGVKGYVTGASGRGVSAHAVNDGDVENYGGYFTAAGTNGRGVYALASGQYGRAFEGIAIGTTGTNHGGYFEANGPTGRGVYGRATGSSGTGVRGSGVAYDFFAAGPGTPYGTESSIRWKQNIQEIEGALELIMQMRGVYFDWDEDHGGRHDLGFIAEEVGEYVPEVVGFESDSDYASGMDYGKMTPILLEAIKEQQGIILELREEIKTLREEVKAIRDGR